MELDKQPLVSVVVVCYNQKQFIKQCINSILQQEYTNIEIILADDCSTDGTKDICLEFKKLYPEKIKLSLSQENEGVTKNCNNGLAMCTGTLLCLTGGDDIFLPGKLLVQVDWFVKNPTGAICTGDIEVFESATDKTIYILRSKGYLQGGPVKKIIRQRNQPPSSNFMINRVLCADLKFDERTPVVSDWFFFIEACMRGKIGYIKKVCLRYRRHSQNVTAAGKYKSYLDDRLIYTDLLISKYPAYSRSCKIQRANIFFETAKREFFTKNFKLARLRALAGIKEYVFDLRNWVMIIASIIGNPAYKIAVRLKR